MPWDEDNSPSPAVKPAAEQRRVALVIGNGAYDHGRPLANPEKDAAAVAAMFGRLGFELHGGDEGWHKDLGFIEMRRVLADFSIKAENADMAVVYFAGHGMEINGENYLLPKDCMLEHVRRVRAESIALSDVLNDVGGAHRLPMVILDACRVNEFAERIRGLEITRSMNRAGGAVDLEPKEGDVLVAYAARGGQPALDGEGKPNSPYAEALLQHLETPGVDVRRLLDRVRDTVLDATGRQQVPHYYASLPAADILLGERPPSDERSTNPTPHTPAISEAERRWQQIRGTRDIGLLKVFEAQFAGTIEAYYAAQDREELEREQEAERQHREAEQKAAERRLREGPWDFLVGIRDAGAEKRLLKPGDVFRDFDNGPEMVIIQPGTFIMGEADKAHKVTLSQPFAMGRYAVTFDEWDTFASATNGYRPTDDGWGRGRRPVINVSWEDTQAYIKWLNEKMSGREDRPYRLPTEAEWEYACRAGTTTEYSTGDTISKKQAHFSEGDWGNPKQTVEVGSFPANQFGLHDMHGNVWEWVHDRYGDYKKEHLTDPKGPGSGSDRVSRGGSWGNYARFLRSAIRGNGSPGCRNPILGFRLLRQPS